MPMYEYACQKCDHTFEALVMGDESVECPECQSRKLDKLISVPGRPRTQSGGLPMTCDPNTPVCGPACRKLM